MRRRLAFALLAAGALLAQPSPAAVGAEEGDGRRAIDNWVTSELTPFSSESEFERYLRDVRRAARARGLHWAGPLYPPGFGEESITVTGSRIEPRNPSITNVQERGVDEGDIVKQVGDYLIVLKDGRLFSIDLRAGDGNELALAGRVDVYRDPRVGTWYDEILVRGDRILATAFSWERRVSELSVFRLGADGSFQREAVFTVDSEDYYDPENYATRLIGDNLIFYTPLDLTEIEPGQRLRFPRIRRLAPDGTESPGTGRPLMDIGDAFRPLQPALEPTLHSVSICPLAAARSGYSLSCRTRAFVGPRARIFYVTPTDIFLWLASGIDDDAGRIDPAACAAALRNPRPQTSYRSVMYRVPVSGEDSSVLAIRGGGHDQFSYSVRNGRFRALLGWFPEACGPDDAVDDRHDVAFFTVPLTRFDTVLREAPLSSYTVLPRVTGDRVVNRITDTHLVYGALRAGQYKDDDWRPFPSQIVAVEMTRPSEPVVLQLPHNIERAERAGDDVLMTGHRAGGPGLEVSLIDLSGRPRLGSTISLAGRFESEGRSHAFNHFLDRDGSGILALPTVRRRARKARSPSWSRPSDLEFLRVDSVGRLASAGRLSSSLPAFDRDGPHVDGEQDEDEIPGYSCEVSCTQWYGNSRPIFSDGRIFGLSATELIEGRMENGRIVEVRRIDFARTPPPPAR